MLRFVTCCNLKFVTNRYGVKIWYFKGKRHREDGPAVTWPNGQCAYYVLGKAI